MNTKRFWLSTLYVEIDWSIIILKQKIHAGIIANVRMDLSVLDALLPLMFE